MMLDAAASGEITKLTSILSDGTDINECDHYGRTAMHLACAEGHLQMVAYLINLRANVSGEDKSGREPLNEAIENGHGKIVSILVQNGAELTQEGKSNYEGKMRGYACDGNLNGLMKLIECGVSPFSVDYLGRTLLHVAVDHGHLDLTKQLISEGLKIDQKDKSGCTAMQLAKCLGTQDLQRLLLSLRCRERATYLNDHAASFALMQSCPEPIANAMLQGRSIEPLYKDQASLFFSDIVGFTAISSKMEPARVSRMLDALFKRLDRLAHLHGVQKVDVMGDAYIAATNFTQDQPDDHAARLARFAVDAVAAAATVAVDEDGPAGRLFLQIRAGIHCGPVTGIVADRAALKYTLLGEAVHVAARMESGGEPGRVQCSAAIAGLIEAQADDLTVRPRCLPADGFGARAGPASGSEPGIFEGRVRASDRGGGLRAAPPAPVSRFPGPPEEPTAGSRQLAPCRPGRSACAGAGVSVSGSTGKARGREPASDDENFKRDLHQGTLIIAGRRAHGREPASEATAGSSPQAAPPATLPLSRGRALPLST